MYLSSPTNTCNSISAYSSAALLLCTDFGTYSSAHTDITADSSAAASAPATISISTLASSQVSHQDTLPAVSTTMDVANHRSPDLRQRCTCTDLCCNYLRFYLFLCLLWEPPSFVDRARPCRQKPRRLTTRLNCLRPRSRQLEPTILTSNCCTTSNPTSLLRPQCPSAALLLPLTTLLLIVCMVKFPTSLNHTLLRSEPSAGTNAAISAPALTDLRLESLDIVSP